MIVSTRKPHRWITAGQTLVETVIASGIAVMVLVTLVAGVTVSLRNVQFARNKAQATKYAQEASEAVRSIRDRDWNQFTNGDHGLQWLAGPPPQWNFTGTVEVFDRFNRVITISDAGDPELKSVRIKVSWLEGSLVKDVTVYTMVAKL